MSSYKLTNISSKVNNNLLRLHCTMEFVRTDAQQQLRVAEKIRTMSLESSAAQMENKFSRGLWMRHDMMSIADNGEMLSKFSSVPSAPVGFFCRGRIGAAASVATSISASNTFASTVLDDVLGTGTTVPAERT